jgi:hypothetical protein
MSQRRSWQSLELRFHEPKVSFVIEPAGSLLDYLIFSFTMGSHEHVKSYTHLAVVSRDLAGARNHCERGVVKSHPPPQALYICAGRGRGELWPSLRQYVRQALEFMNGGPHWLPETPFTTSATVMKKGIDATGVLISPEDTAWYL